MQLAAHELYDLHDLTASCANSITSMGHFLQQAQEPALRSLIEQHLPFHVADYNKKVSLLQQNGMQIPFSASPLRATLADPTALPVPPAPAVTPRTDAQLLDDREICLSYLLTLKRAGREYAWAAMEMANAEIRTFLEQAFMLSSHQAYDVWQYMVQHGWYPVHPADQAGQELIAGAYNPVPATGGLRQGATGAPGAGMGEPVMGTGQTLM
ncbi:MAG TPA: spore coat protein [Symbiobacteriaceae bacterium]|nr:spore coat protein [Symbiobacteriaceae bacterium]